MNSDLCPCALCKGLKHWSRKTRRRHLERFGLYVEDICDSPDGSITSSVQSGWSDDEHTSSADDSSDTSDSDSDDVASGSDANSDVDETTDLTLVGRQFSSHLLRLLNNGARVTDITAFMRLTDRLLSPHLPPTLSASLPSTMWQLDRRTADTVPIDYHTVDACPHDCVLFYGEYADLLRCPECDSDRYDEHDQPVRQGYFANVADTLRRFWRNPLLSKLAKYRTWDVANTDPSHLVDSLDASLLNSPEIKEYHAASVYNMSFTMCSDAVQLTKWPRRSFTPVLLFNLNLPPWVRFRHSCIWLVALLPANTKSDQAYHKYVLEHFRDGFTDGIQVEDAAEEGKRVLCRTLITSCINDYRGVPKCNLQAQAPAHQGACKDCNTVGIRYYKSGSQYPGHCRFLATSPPLRDRYHAEFKGSVKHQGIHAQPLLRHLTDNQVRRKQEQGAGYHGVDVFTKLTPLWRPMTCHVNDLGHLIMNNVTDLLFLVAGFVSWDNKPASKRMDFKGAYRYAV